MSARSRETSYLKRATNLLRHNAIAPVFYSHLEGGKGRLTHAQVDAMKITRDHNPRINQPQPGKKTAPWRYVKVAA